MTRNNAEENFREWPDIPGYHPIMKCGHAANAITTYGYPVCAICIGIDSGAEIVDNQPDLTGRMARCICLQVVPSDTKEAFFEYRGAGSRYATDLCGNCGFAHVAHYLYADGGLPSHKVHINCRHCLNFTARGPFEFDSYYCGCKGWD